jgi:hypothetical protein
MQLVIEKSAQTDPQFACQGLCEIDLMPHQRPFSLRAEDFRRDANELVGSSLRVVLLVDRPARRFFSLRLSS